MYFHCLEGCTIKSSNQIYIMFGYLHVNTCMCFASACRQIILQPRVCLRMYAIDSDYKVLTRFQNVINHAPSFFLKGFLFFQIHILDDGAIVGVEGCDKCIIIDLLFDLTLYGNLFIFTLMQIIFVLLKLVYCVKCIQYLIDGINQFCRSS